MAWNTILADPTSWVVRINWNDHTGKLQEINAATFNFDWPVEFLFSAAFTESKYTHINRSILKQVLQNSGNGTVLIDGFDEFSPLLMRKDVAILSEIMKTKFGRDSVTLLNVEKERLEKEQSVSPLVRKIYHVNLKENVSISDYLNQEKNVSNWPTS